MLGRHDVSVTCPWCGVWHPLASNTEFGDTTAPAAGHPVLCIKCGRWSIYAGKRGRLKLRKPTEEEMVDIESDDHCMDVKRAWAITIATTRR
jgi:hypothetical protein